jgi:RNA recognition motif-containing protein
VPQDSSEDELLRMLASFGEVRGYRRVETVPKGPYVSCLVEYETSEDAAACVGNMNGMLIRGQFLVAGLQK